jgi:magnesium-transporting ATPase (P-type)
MSEARKRFADELIAADPSNQNAREHYEKEIRAMLEKTLTPRQRGLYLVFALLLILPALFFAAILVGHWQERPQSSEADVVKFVVVYMSATVLIMLILAVILFRLYWRGVLNHRTIQSWAVTLGVAYLGLVAWLFWVFSRHLPEILRDELRGFSVVFLVYAACAWLRHRITQAESKTAEKLLEIELRMEELAACHQPPPATAP